MGIAGRCGVVWLVNHEPRHRREHGSTDIISEMQQRIEYCLGLVCVLGASNQRFEENSSDLFRQKKGLLLRKEILNCLPRS